jgi:hypothetical protein
MEETRRMKEGGERSVRKRERRREGEKWRG